MTSNNHLSFFFCHAITFGFVSLGAALRSTTIYANRDHFWVNQTGTVFQVHRDSNVETWLQKADLAKLDLLSNDILSNLAGTSCVNKRNKIWNNRKTVGNNITFVDVMKVRMGIWWNSCRICRSGHDEIELLREIEFPMVRVLEGLFLKYIVLLTDTVIHAYHLNAQYLESFFESNLKLVEQKYSCTNL